MSSIDAVNSLNTLNAAMTLNSAITQTVNANDPTTGTGQASGHHGHHHHKVNSGADGQNTSTSGLDSLLEQNGIDPNELADMLQGSSSSPSTSNQGNPAANGGDTPDFATQLQNLISQYGNKGVLYDTTL